MSGAPGSSDPIQRMAEERTASAHVRTVLAEERTCSAWLRTGLASVATGFAIAKLAPIGDRHWLYQILGLLFIAIGASMFVLAFTAYRRSLSRMAVPGQRSTSLVVGAISLMLLLGAALAAVLVLMP